MLPADISKAPNFTAASARVDHAEQIWSVSSSSSKSSPTSSSRLQIDLVEHELMQARIRKQACCGVGRSAGSHRGVRGPNV